MGGGGEEEMRPMSQSRERERERKGSKEAKSGCWRRKKKDEGQIKGGKEEEFDK